MFIRPRKKHLLTELEAEMACMRSMSSMTDEEREATADLLTAIRRVIGLTNNVEQVDEPTCCALCHNPIE